MKALITAGGHGTRLRPITYTTNKHLIPLAGEPMIFHAIKKVAQVGIKEIYINTNPGETEIQQAVGNGARWGVKIKFFEQIGGPRGIADAVRQAQQFIGCSPFILYLGDNIILSSIRKFAEYFKNAKLNCFLALSKVSNPSHFGVPVIKDSQIKEVIEKPQKPPSPYAVTGIYIYDKNIWPAIKQLKLSSRGEYEISDAHTWLIRKGFKVGYKEITGWWKDTGRAEDLLNANQLLLLKLKENVMGKIDKSVVMQGNIKIGKRTVIQGQTILRGPLVIGENCVIRDSYIGPFTTVGNRVELYNAEVERSIIFDDADIHTNARIVDSLIGANSTIISSHQSLPSGHKLIIGSNSMIEL